MEVHGLMIGQSYNLRGPRFFVAKGRNISFRPGDVPSNNVEACHSYLFLEDLVALKRTSTGDPVVISDVYDQHSYCISASTF